ncbi:MAG: aldo/keto reductase, partial [Pseudomonadota bacterium]
MNAQTYITPGTFALGGDLIVNRLGYGAMRLTDQPANFGPYPNWEQG